MAYINTHILFTVSTALFKSSVYMMFLCMAVSFSPHPSSWEEGQGWQWLVGSVGHAGTELSVKGHWVCACCYATNLSVKFFLGRQFVQQRCH